MTGTVPRHTIGIRFRLPDAMRDISADADGVLLKMGETGSVRLKGYLGMDQCEAASQMNIRSRHPQKNSVSEPPTRGVTEKTKPIVKTPPSNEKDRFQEKREIKEPKS